MGSAKGSTYKICLPYDKAKEFVNSLNLKNNDEWKTYTKSTDIINVHNQSK